MNNLKLSIILLAWLLITGCAQLDIAKSGGSKVMDEAANNAEYILCQAISIGAAKRRYGKDQDTADAYNKLCEGDGNVNLVGQ